MEQALGKSFTLGATKLPREEPPPYVPNAVVIGVAQDIRGTIAWEKDATGVYLPVADTALDVPHLLVRLSGAATVDDLPRLRREVRVLAPEAPVSVQPLEEVLRIALLPFRAAAVFSSILGVFGLLVAAVGVYGTMQYSVRLRTHEIGVRLALGATPGEVVKLAVRRGARLIAIATALGIGGAAAATRLISGVLFDLGPLDLTTFTGVPLFLMSVAVAAAWLPARHAARVDPAVALRHE